jgi:hypothetical protein
MSINGRPAGGWAIRTPTNGGHINDGAATELAHLRDHMSGHHDHTGYVDAEISVPGREIDFGSITHSTTHADLTELARKPQWLILRGYTNVDQD